MKLLLRDNSSFILAKENEGGVFHSCRNVRVVTAKRMTETNHIGVVSCLTA